MAGAGAAAAQGANAAAVAAAITSAGEAMRVEGVLMPSRPLSAPRRRGISAYPLRPAAEGPEQVYAVDLVRRKRLHVARCGGRDTGPRPAVGRVGAHAGAGGRGDNLDRRGRRGVDEAARVALVGRRGAGGAVLGGEARARAVERDRVLGKRL